MLKNTVSPKVQEELAIFEHSFDLIAQRFRLKSDLQVIKSYIFEQDLADFLIWVEQPIIDVFEQARTTLQWQQNTLILTIFSSSTDKEEDENRLFEQFDHFHAIDHVLNHIDIHLH
ncbi:MAG: hypothetical protein QG557_1082 [Pseudomonadota bacterium]|jgi:hypothetical protein|nr:hypothetical protein [Pseudomonadota bacterium]